MTPKVRYSRLSAVSLVFLFSLTTPRYQHMFRCFAKNSSEEKMFRVARVKSVESVLYGMKYFPENEIFLF